MGGRTLGSRACQQVKRVLHYTYIHTNIYTYEYEYSTYINVYIYINHIHEGNLISI